MSETPAKEAAVNAEKGEPGGAKASPKGDAGGSRDGKGGRRNRGRRRGGNDGDKKPREGRDKKGGGRKGGGRRDGRRGRDKDRGGGTLTAGLFASVADKEVPCRVAGCKKTWTWWGSEQIKAFGQPPPKRMCDEHLAAFHELADKELPCRNAGCENTWTWKRGAQLHQLQRQEKIKTPRRLCESCAGEEKNITDTQVECRVPGCDHTWTWSADAQRRHAAWLRREKAKLEAAEAKAKEPEVVEAEPEDAPADVSAAPAQAAPVDAEAAPAEAQEAQAEAEGAPAEAEETPTEAEEAPVEAAPAEGEPVAEGTAPAKKKKRRRRKKPRQKKLQEGPPEKLCESCSEQIKKFAGAEQACKVHGCKQTWTWDREHQLRAWVAAGRPESLEGLKPLRAQRRMCNSCRDFVRAHKDREVKCGKPECDKTWMYKTGAQLQDQLAGRTADPIKLCEECMKEQFMAPGVHTGQLPEGAEVMPCGVAGCDGTWIYVPTMELMSAEGGEVPVDRMCDRCRGERGLDARGMIISAPGIEPAPEAADASPAADAPQEAENASEAEPAQAPEAAEAPVVEDLGEPESTSNEDASGSDS